MQVKTEFEGFSLVDLACRNFFTLSPPCNTQRSPFNKNKPPSPLEEHTDRLTRTGGLETSRTCGTSFDGPTSPRPQSIPAVTRYPSRRCDPPTNLFKKHFVRRFHIKPYCFLTPLGRLFLFIITHPRRFSSLVLS